MNEKVPPIGWIETSLATVVPKVQYGVSVPLGDDHGVPVLRMNNLREGSVDVEDITLSASVEASRLTLAPNDVLFNRTNSIEQVGRTSLWRGELDVASFASYLVRLIPDSARLHPEYLVRWLNLPQTQLTIREFATPGVSQVNINPTNLRRVEICFPCKLAEQGRILTILSTIDKTIEQTEALIAKYQQIKAGLMHDLLTRGVTADGRLRPPRSEATHVYEKSGCGWIPKQWRTLAIGEMFNRRVERGRAGLPVMAITMAGGLVERDSVDRRVDSRLGPEGHLLVRTGDIAYNMMRMWQGVLGRATYDCLVSPAYIVLQPGPMIDSIFAEYLFSTDEAIAAFKRRSYGVVDDRLRLYFRDLVRIRFAIPVAKEEQVMITERLGQADEMIRKTHAVVVKLQEQKHGLMHDLLTGRVRIKVDEATTT